MKFGISTSAPGRGAKIRPNIRLIPTVLSRWPRAALQFTFSSRVPHTGIIFQLKQEPVRLILRVQASPTRKVTRKYLPIVVCRAFRISAYRKWYKVFKIMIQLHVSKACSARQVQYREETGPQQSDWSYPIILVNHVRNQRIAVGKGWWQLITKSSTISRSSDKGKNGFLNFFFK